MANHSKSQAKHPCTAVYLFVAVLFFVGYLLFSESPPAQSNTPRKGNGTAVGTDARTGATTLQPLIHDPTYDAEMTSVVEVAKLRAFEEWLHRNGAVNNLSIRRTASAGFTTMARVAFKKDELLFKVPHEIILTPFKLMKPMVDASAKEGSPFHFYKDWLAKEEPTALFIMHEMQPKRHGKSFWTPYFDMLPRDYESFHPLFWNDEQLEYLVPEISGFVSNLRTKVQNSYDALLRNLIKKRPDLIPEDEFTFKRFATAFLNVYTRAYARPDDIATDEKVLYVPPVAKTHTMLCRTVCRFIPSFPSPTVSS